MTAAISSSVGTAPLTASPNLYEVLANGTNIGGDTSMRSDYTVEDPSGTIAPPMPADATIATTAGGGRQAATGAANVDPQQLNAVLQQVLDSVNQLIAAIKAQGGVTGGGASGVGACGMPGCDMDHGSTGADAAPTKPATKSAKASSVKPLRSSHPSAAAPTTTDPGTVKDKTGLTGLTAASKRGLVEAHKYGLPLVSGKRSGNGESDHDSGNAIDVSTLPIGVAGSNGATPQMQAFREHMRALGKAGKLDVKYIISDGRIASAVNNWEWRPYTYPGMSAAQVAALKSSNRGEYNRLEHFDHVHVSFG
jgi:hypothetical protein